jgi:hypothetical protein
MTTPVESPGRYERRRPDEEIAMTYLRDFVCTASSSLPWHDNIRRQLLTSGR